jgi:hypothetical protein
MGEIGEGNQEPISVDTSKLSPAAEATINKKADNSEEIPTFQQELAGQVNRIVIGQELLADIDISQEARKQVRKDLKDTIEEIKAMLGQGQSIENFDDQKESDEIDEMTKEVVQQWEESGVLNNIHPLTLHLSGLYKYRKK